MKPSTHGESLEEKVLFGSTVVQYAYHLLIINMESKTPKSTAAFLAAFIQ